MSNPYRETAGYGMHSVALQVKDLRVSLAWYQHVLGMEIVKETVTSGVQMTFIGYSRNMVPGTEFGARQALIQLIYVDGSENDPTFKINRKTNGFCHISISVPDIEVARNRAKSLDVEIVEEGSNSKGFAVLADPDGYHIQLLSNQIHEKLELEKACESILSLDGFQLKHLDGDFKEGFSVDPRVAARGGSPELSHAYWGYNKSGGPISPINSSFGESMDRGQKSGASPRGNGNGRASGSGSGSGNSSAKTSSGEGKGRIDTPSQDR